MEPEFGTNYDLNSIVTPIDVQKLESLLVQSNYDPSETQFVVQGFRDGFDLEYSGPTNRTSRSRNIPFTIGTKTHLWNKLIKEVKLKRVAGPFDEIPFQNYIQSPIGLVPKTGGKMRLIFHLSYQFGPNEQSVNHHTPKEKFCKVL